MKQKHFNGGVAACYGTHTHTGTILHTAPTLCLEMVRRSHVANVILLIQTTPPQRSSVHNRKALMLIIRS